MLGGARIAEFISELVSIDVDFLDCRLKMVIVQSSDVEIRVLLSE